MDWEQIGKVIGVLAGAGVFGAVGSWLSHFFASGDIRVADRRKDKDETQTRIKGLEDLVQQMGRNVSIAGRVRNCQMAEINRLSWNYDEMHKVLLAMVEIVVKCEPSQKYLVEQAKSFRPADEVLEEAERLFNESNPPDGESLIKNLRSAQNA